MTCHPSHPKPSKVDPRAVKRQHRWKHGHDPQDPDADEASPFTYLTLEQEARSDPDQRHLLRGGPESGLPCSRCGHMTRIAATKTVKEIYEQEQVELVNKNILNEKDWERLENERICALACPNCDQVTQMREEFVPRVRKG